MNSMKEKKCTMYKSEEFITHNGSMRKYKRLSLTFHLTKINLKFLFFIRGFFSCYDNGFQSSIQFKNKKENMQRKNRNKRIEKQYKTIQL